MQTINKNVNTHLAKQDIFIPIMRTRCEAFPTLPEEYGSSRKNRRINNLGQFIMLLYLTTTLTLAFAFTRLLVKCDPINPAPPVTSILLLLK